MKNLSLILLLLPFMLFAQNTKIIAHRGASGYCPENTLAAVQEALNIGVDLIEIDIHLSKDGEVMVLHDISLDRTTNGKGDIEDYSFEELKALDAGSWFAEKYTGEKIPSLKEVLELCKGICAVLIEVKKGKDYYRDIEKKAWEIVQELGMEDEVEFQSFYAHSLKEMEKLGINAPIHKLLVGVYPGFPIYIDHQLRFGNYFYKEEVELSGVNPNERFVTKAFLNKIKADKLVTYVWTVNEENTMRKLIKSGVDGIITNYPRELKKILNE